MNVLVTGSSGLIGSALLPLLTADGHRVRRLVRSREQLDESAFLWDPDSGTIDETALQGVDAAVNLAGETVAGRWTEAKKRRILESRVKSTRLLSEALAYSEPRPRVLVSASAVGYYGDRGDEQLDEGSAPGSGFLVDVTRAWEAATEAAAQAGIRVVTLRTGIVLTPSGGALQRMLLPFRGGLGGRFGSGRQYMSWISLDDHIDAVRHALATDEISGTVNSTAPNPVRNEEFAKTLGRVLRRPAVLAAPAVVLRLALGEFAREGILAGQRVLPRRLLETGYRFRHPELAGALRELLGKD